MNKKQLYESIMKNVSSEVKKTLNENKSDEIVRDMAGDLARISSKYNLEPDSNDFNNLVKNALLLFKRKPEGLKFSDDLVNLIKLEWTRYLRSCVRNSKRLKWEYDDFTCTIYEKYAEVNLPYRNNFDTIPSYHEIFKQLNEYIKWYKPEENDTFISIWEKLGYSVQKTFAQVINEITLNFFDKNANASYKDYLSD
ncbi:MAG: hypothetical protein [Wendovervirus sonii]|uniref:Uncharacterized protein n=1 Tax=phage Lak_Megaphage_Sonny TaxID=3109229 RepID=A0ABZ0Z355_9CAUD|nr:MAG: hypothetical protein [phage Lak_Megaphage_Sonny]